MFAVAFEVLPSASGYQRYLDTAASLRPILNSMDGFVSIERFKSLTDPGWILSLSFWRDEAALVRWRMQGEHRAAQAQGRASVFDDHRLRVLRILPAVADGEQMPLVGIRAYADMADDARGKRFESLTNADKRIGLLEFADCPAAREWQIKASASPDAGLQPYCAVVLRDYGMFDRAQAPQQFPPASRRHGST
ncbi:MAG TPA: antibiotic biosynthesis monooxygenase [Noviherbaspirillum sp.]|uniref:antibiotic biosynthesis monooxygenase family protein n=1 Tax=Noviherbaspirillum sp. TaxID=1926288 RepID=UPI002DDDBB40|nr:antibiotic biosynthesis monooxygenase [Noviherbaspirillum sp.]HEV2611488.1 antibiotic biosynthesis monooxygenase [Noviherbaspirillum sp.]